MFSKVISILIIGLFTSATLSCLAEDDSINIKSYVDKDKIKLNETIQLTIKIEGNISNPKIELPNLAENFDVITSLQSQNISIKGKEKSAILEFIYILQPKKEGKYTIAAVSLKYKGKVFNTEPINIEVLPQDKISTPELPPEEVPIEEGEETII